MQQYTINQSQILILGEIRAHLGNFMIPDRRSRNMGYDALGELIEELLSQELPWSPASPPVPSPAKPRTQEKRAAEPTA